MVLRRNFQAIQNGFCDRISIVVPPHTRSETQGRGGTTSQELLMTRLLQTLLAAFLAILLVVPAMAQLPTPTFIPTVQASKYPIPANDCDSNAHCGASANQPAHRNLHQRIDRHDHANRRANSYHINNHHHPDWAFSPGCYNDCADVQRAC